MAVFEYYNVFFLSAMEENARVLVIKVNTATSEPEIVVIILLYEGDSYVCTGVTTDGNYVGDTSM